MSSFVEMVMFSDYDLGQMSVVMRKACRRSLTAEADKLTLTAEAHNMKAVQGVQDVDVLNLFFASFMMIVDSRDITDVLQVTGMPFTWSETANRGFVLILASGSLAQWGRAIEVGCSESVETEVREVFNKVKKEFDKRRIRCTVEMEERYLPDDTFLLEYRP